MLCVCRPAFSYFMSQHFHLSSQWTWPRRCGGTVASPLCAFRLAGHTVTTRRRTGETAIGDVLTSANISATDFQAKSPRTTTSDLSRLTLRAGAITGMIGQDMIDVSVFQSVLAKGMLLFSVPSLYCKTALSGCDGLSSSKTIYLVG